MKPHSQHYPRYQALPIFGIGLILSLFYWVVGVSIIFSIRIVSVLFLSPSKLRELGYLTGTAFFKGFFLILEAINVLKIDDDELLKFCNSKSRMIIASNHPSLWDAPLLLRRFTRMSGIMKADILNNPFLRSGSEFIGFIANYPSLRMVRSARGLLENGGQLLLFPEGTRTRNKDHNKLNTFQPGLGYLAKKNEAIVLPVFIYMDCDYLQKGWPIWKLPRLPVTVSIKVGDGLRAHSEESHQLFSERLEGYFAREIEKKDPFLHQR